MSRLTTMRQQRLDKAKTLREMGFDPYPAESERTHTNKEVVTKFNQLENEEVTLAGRLMSFRNHGHLIFGDLVDVSGKIQLYIKDDSLSPTESKSQSLGFEDLRLLDSGDIVQATGTVTKTQAGEISLLVTQLKLLTKAIRPLPDSWEGLKDPEIKFRRRYVDFLINPESRQLFERKAKFWSANRQYMLDHGFIEVETPILEQVTGGADARPFTTYMNALDQNFFLRISTELYQKRLIGGGFEKVYTIGPNFRNEGLSDEHLPEYYQIEWYWAYADYRDNMKMVEDMIRFIAKSVYGTTRFIKNQHTFDLADNWVEISYPDIIKEKLGIDIFNDSDEKMKNKVNELGIKLEGLINRQRLIDNLWKSIRKTISGPAFLVNEPKFMSPLAKSKLDNPELTQRFHIIIAGSELGNGYSELNDPLDQLERFQSQQAARDQGDDEAQMLDIDFVEMLEYGMPPTSGYAHSERLFWFLENVTAREGTLFPQLKSKLEESTKEIYGIKDPVKPKTPQLNLAKNPTSNQEISFPTLDQKDIFSFAPSYKITYPSTTIGLAVIKGVSITKSNPELEKEKRSLVASFKDLTNETISAFPEVQSYRQLYKDMKVDWHSRRPSPEALMRRISQGKNLYNINTCVDAYNLVVLKNRVSIGAFDLDQVQFPTTLEIAKGGEQILLLGDTEPTTLKAGEISYFDQEGPYNLDFNYRDAQRTMVTESTANLLINIDGVYGITRDQVEQSLKETIELIQKYCGGTVELAEVVEAKA